MNDILEVKEKYSEKWKPGLYASFTISVLTFLLYLNLDSILWSGIFRLVAFISLTVGIFCMLKVMEGAKTFEVKLSKDSVLITYLKNNNVISTESFSLDDIRSIYRESHNIKLPFFDLYFQLPQHNKFKIKFRNEEEKEMSLFKFGGKILTLDERSAEKLEHFLKQHNLIS